MQEAFIDREKTNILGNLFEIESFSQREGEIVATAQLQVLSVATNKKNLYKKTAMLVSK